MGFKVRGFRRGLRQLISTLSKAFVLTSRLCQTNEHVSTVAASCRQFSLSDSLIGCGLKRAPSAPDQHDASQSSWTSIESVSWLEPPNTSQTWNRTLHSGGYTP
jgi:hypothetical protein